MKKSIIKLLGIVIVIIGILAVLLFQKETTYDMDIGNLRDVDFTQDVYHKGLAYISGNQMFSSSGRYICFDDMNEGRETVLCSIPNCEHNSDECMGIFDATHLQEFVYVYNQKLIVGGAASDGLAFFSAELDGSNHEEIASLKYKDVLEYQLPTEENKDNVVSFPTYSTLDFLNFVVKDSKVYIGLSVEDESDIEQLEDGSMSGGPCIAAIFCFDMEKHDITKIYEADETHFSEFIQLRYLQGDRLYFDNRGMELPYHEMYDLETGELKSPELRSKIINRAGYLDLNTLAVTWVQGYQFNDYIGSRGGNRFFVESDKADADKAAGVIRVEDFEGKEVDRIEIDELKGIDFYYDANMFVSEEGFILTIPDLTTPNGDNEVYLYDKSGALVKHLKKSEYAIIDETKEYYLLAKSYQSIGLTAYVRKEDVERMNRKLNAMYQ